MKLNAGILTSEFRKWHFFKILSLLQSHIFSDNNNDNNNNNKNNEVKKEKKNEVLVLQKFRVYELLFRPIDG